MRAPRFQRKKPEPTITLINVVFLMLIFFLVAGTIAPPVPTEVRLVQVAGNKAAIPPNILVIDATGQTLSQHGPMDAAAFVAALPADAAGIARVMPDRDLPAKQLIAVARALRQAGAREVRLMTERTTE
ncbi:ExbD/TolR family protein [Pseudorhodobacter sp.]|uniref:ExbD/TolR family protein n=1 Tax=Pseudorhodobacter sp. TaxID=1934400 RepID=UPI002AFF2028|nr:biopolymer transporter ExbD [Pseudorhodobacter sp.]